MKRLSLLVFHLKQIPVFLYSISNDRSSFDMPDSRRASEDLLLPQPRDVGPIMSPISEISGLVVNSNETIEETSEFEAAMKDRRASLTLPVNAQPCIEILAKKKSTPQVTLSPTYARLKQSSPSSSRIKMKKNRSNCNPVVIKRRRKFEKSHGSVSLDITDTELQR